MISNLSSFFKSIFHGPTSSNEDFTDVDTSYNVQPMHPPVNQKTGCNNYFEKMIEKIDSELRKMIDDELIDSYCNVLVDDPNFEISKKVLHLTRERDEYEVKSQDYSSQEFVGEVNLSKCIAVRRSFHKMSSRKIYLKNGKFICETTSLDEILLETSIDDEEDELFEEFKLLSSRDEPLSSE